MTATHDIWHFRPYRPNRPTTVPAVSLGFPMLGTYGTVDTVEIEEELLLYIKDYSVRESSILGVPSVPSVPAWHTLQCDHKILIAVSGTEQKRHFFFQETASLGQKTDDIRCFDLDHLDQHQITAVSLNH
jgi:hypothetical protein